MVDTLANISSSVGRHIIEEISNQKTRNIIFGGFSLTLGEEMDLIR